MAAAYAGFLHSEPPPIGMNGGAADQPQIHPGKRKVRVACAAKYHVGARLFFAPFGSSMRAYLSLVWIAVYLALVIAPVAGLLLAPVPPGKGFWVDAALAMGYAGLAMMGVQFFLTARFRRATAPFGIDIIYYFHRLMAVFGFGLILAHAVILLAVKPGLAGRLLSPDIPLHAIAAVAALGLLIVLIAASIWRKQLRIRYEPWRRWHGALAGLALILALAHVEMTGYYLQAPWKRGVWTLLVVSCMLLLFHVRVIKPLLMLRRPYRVESVRKERGDSWTLRVSPVGHAGLRFEPGQFAWLTLARSPFSLSEHPFSIASSAAQPGGIEFTIKELGDFTRTIGGIPVGTRAYVDGPHGVFSVDRFPGASGFVFLAGGVGIAPVMSMLRTLADRGDTRPLTLIYGNWNWDHVIFREELEQLTGRLKNLTLVHVLQEAPPDWTGETGLLTQDLLGRHLPESTRGQVYFVCGPKPMIALVERALHQLGVPVRNINSELFDLV
jgi:predicted ferric reductase